MPGDDHVRPPPSLSLPPPRRGPDGKDVTKVDPVKLRLGIGYVIQSAGLMPHQRVIDNVATVPVLRGESRTGGYRVRVRRDMKQDNTPRIEGPK